MIFSSNEERERERRARERDRRIRKRVRREGIGTGHHCGWWRTTNSGGNHYFFVVDISGTVAAEAMSGHRERSPATLRFS
ncbi:hypothetical protein HanIR_Chr14g0678221 [Helianthus annuus]|nr:hypothetical protein HanIR_Chr14g0678221 [Helianthus annuus]